MLRGAKDIFKASLKAPNNSKASSSAKPDDDAMRRNVDRAMALLQAWSVVVQLLGVAFVNPPKTGQMLLDVSLASTCFDVLGVFF